MRDYFFTYTFIMERTIIGLYRREVGFAGIPVLLTWYSVEAGEVFGAESICSLSSTSLSMKGHLQPSPAVPVRGMDFPV